MDYATLKPGAHRHDRAGSFTAILDYTTLKLMSTAERQKARFTTILDYTILKLFRAERDVLFRFTTILDYTTLKPDALTANEYYGPFYNPALQGWRPIRYANSYHQSPNRFFLYS